MREPPEAEGGHVGLRFLGNKAAQTQWLKQPTRTPGRRPRVRSPGPAWLGPVCSHGLHVRCRPGRSTTWRSTCSGPVLTGGRTRPARSLGSGGCRASQDPPGGRLLPRPPGRLRAPAGAEETRAARTRTGDPSPSHVTQPGHIPLLCHVSLVRHKPQVLLTLEGRGLHKA